MTNAILRELELQKDYLNGEKVETIYFGGGTPSLLNQEDLEAIFKKIYELHDMAKNPEITFGSQSR